MATDNTCVCVCMCVCARAHAHTHSVMTTLCDSTDCSPQGSSVTSNIHIQKQRVLTMVRKHRTFNRELNRMDFQLCDNKDGTVTQAITLKAMKDLWEGTLWRLNGEEI